MTKLVKVELVEEFPLYDITVEDDHCFQLENGVIAHNSKQIISGGTGLMYSANQAFIIGKSQEKDGTELAGWNFTLNVEKSRWVKEKSKLPLQVLYDSGIQKYSGILDLALESGHAIKPKNGWYALVDMETGVISEKNFRIKDTNSEDFLGKVVAQESFKKFIRERYRIGSMTGKESVEVPEEDLED